MAKPAVATPSVIIDVLARLDCEMRECPRDSKDFNDRMIGINASLFKVDLLMGVVFRFKERVCRRLLLDHSALKKLANQWCAIGKVHDVHAYKNVEYCVKHFVNIWA